MLTKLRRRANFVAFIAIRYQDTLVKSAESKHLEDVVAFAFFIQWIKHS